MAAVIDRPENFQAGCDQAPPRPDVIARQTRATPSAAFGKHRSKPHARSKVRSNLEHHPTPLILCGYFLIIMAQNCANCRHWSAQTGMLLFSAMMMSMSPAMNAASVDVAPLGAVIYPVDFAIDALLSEVAAQLQAGGKRVAGVVQVSLKAAPGCADVMLVRDVASGETTSITQDLGRNSTGCRLDPRGLAVVAGHLAAALDGNPDLLVLNRFGKAEIEGGGLRDLIGAAMARGVKVLTAVRDSHAAEWAEFHQGIAADLPPDAQTVRRWAAAGE
jgi:hypothetical protein